MADQTNTLGGDQINTLVEPWDFKSYRDQHGGQDPERLFFVCPHCRAEVDQSPENFHYWCSSCGKNATEPVQG